MPTCIGNYKIKIIDPAEHPIFNPTQHVSMCGMTMMNQYGTLNTTPSRGPQLHAKGPKTTVYNKCHVTFTLRTFFMSYLRMPT